MFQHKCLYSVTINIISNYINKYSLFIFIYYIIGIKNNCNNELR